MWKNLKDEFIRDAKGLLALIGIIILISIPGWAVLGALYFAGVVLKAFGVEAN